MVVKNYTKTKVDKHMLQRIDELQLSERSERLREAMLSADYKICTDRARLAMESWKETEGDDIQIRKAKVFKKIVEGVPIAVHPFDLLVGRETEYIYGANPQFDWAGDYIEALHEDSDVTVGGPVVKGVLSQEGRDLLRECAIFFRGKTLGDHRVKSWPSLVGTWHDDFMEARGRIGSMNLAGVAGKISRPDWEKVLAKGMRGIIEEAEWHIRRFKEMQEYDLVKLYFWQSVIIVSEAFINFAHRYADLAHRLAEKEQNIQRRSELEEIAEVCEWVPENPPRTFHEAMQFVLFVRIASKLEHPGGASAPARLDQFLRPYFDKDLKEGRLTLETAADLLGDLISSAATLCRLESARTKEMDQASSMITQITVGGLDRDGEDATNELSYLIIHMASLLKFPEPSVIVRWHPDIPQWFWLKAFDMNVRLTGANPQFMSDTHVIENSVQGGASLEEARDYWVSGCLGALVPSKIELPCTGETSVALILDLTLHNGVSPLTGKQIGLETGDPRDFKTFSELVDAFKKQHRFIFNRLIWLGYLERIEEADYGRMPFRSSVAPFCMERGKDIAITDSENYVYWAQDRAIIDTADSLTAVKRLVFDEKRLTIDELLEALDSNFEGERGEEIRQMCLAAPKYGNDIDEADWMVREISTFSASSIRSQMGANGFPWRIRRGGLAWHYQAGKGVGALPNGRKSREPLYDASASPGQGMDKFGPTAVLRSVLKVGFKESLMTLMNQRFSKTLMQSPESREKLAMMTDAFFRAGGQTIQYNVVDTKVLRDAQNHPEKYRDLIVRVAGFCAYFVHLAPEVQDDIISRSEQTL